MENVLSFKILSQNLLFCGFLLYLKYINIDKNKFIVYYIFTNLFLGGVRYAFV